MKIMVTGSAGKIGRHTLPVLRAAGHRAVGLDIAGPVEPGRQLRCDCTDFGAVMGASSGGMDLRLYANMPMSSCIFSKDGV